MSFWRTSLRRRARKCVAALRERGIGMTEPIGFNNTYALAVRGDTAQRSASFHASPTSPSIPSCASAFPTSSSIAATAGLGSGAPMGCNPKNVRGLDHDLAYRGIASGGIDVTDAYTTDAEIAHYHLTLLTDDRHYFPEYNARLSLSPRSRHARAKSGGRARVARRHDRRGPHAAHERGGEARRSIRGCGRRAFRFRDHSAPRRPSQASGFFSACGALRSPI